jgi:hypothetical protein
MACRPKPRRGRPTRAQAAERAASALKALAVDPSTVDPEAILRAIACDTSAPAAARVQACKALLAHQQPTAEPAKPGAGAPPDELTQRALQILGRLN